MSDIRFGTDGWRAIIGKDFTDQNVSRVIQAFCNAHAGASNKKIYVGYDRRLDSDKTAQLVSCVLAANGFEPYLTSRFCPTPCISWMVKTYQAHAGIMVTASHNPPQWNGIKFKESYGGAASPQYTKVIEEHIDTLGDIRAGDFDELVAQKKIQIFEPYEHYVSHLRKFIDTDAITQSGFRVVLDPLFGAGTDYVKEVLQTDVIQIHDAKDPNFGGLNPEPIDKNLQDLRKAVIDSHADIGLATDGDADRIGAYDELGNFINSHQIFSLLLMHNIGYRKLSGAVVKSVSTTQMIEKIGEHFGVQVIETPIGFKHISQELIKHNALMGGEESGGISLREHVHERDGVLNGLLLLEMMAVQKKSLSQLIQDLEQQFGKYCYARDDYHLTDQKIAEVKEKSAQKQVSSVKEIDVLRYNLSDGCKVYFSDGSWLLVRASGTEPLLRVYAEGPSDERVQDLLGFARTHFDL